MNIVALHEKKRLDPALSENIEVRFNQCIKMLEKE